MNIDEIKKLCIKELENQGLKVGKKLEELKQEHKRISNLRIFLSKLKTSKLSTVYEYQALPNEAKQEFSNMINSILHNNRQTDEIITEMANLFFLKKEGLLELDEVSPQREHIEKTLESLINTLEAYIEKFDIADYDKKVQSLSTEMDRIISLGTTLTTKTPELSIIADIPFFKTIIERLDIDEQDKINFIMYAINNNNKIYLDALKRKKDKKKNNKAKEKKESNEKTPYKALQAIYDEYDNESKRKTIKLRSLLEDTEESSLSERYEQLLIRQAYNYKDQEKENKDDFVRSLVKEIEYILDLIENLDSTEEDASSLMSKAVKKVEEIFRLLIDNGQDINKDIKKILESSESNEKKSRKK